MRLWAVYPLTVWQQWQRTGTLHGDGRRVPQHFRAAYAWMTEQMQQRLQRPARTTPLWAWAQWRGEARRRPDLRASGLEVCGTRAARLELEVADDAVLLSDFELWHFVLNDWYLPTCERDFETFSRIKRALPTEAAGEWVRRSWQRIFDLSWADPYISVPRDKKSVQATLWDAPLSAVRDVTEFVAR